MKKREIFTPKKLQSQAGACANCSDRSTPCTIRGCLPARTSRAWLRRLKRLCQNQSMKRSLEIHTCWNFSICRRTSISMNPILSRRSSIICKSSCSNSAEASPLSPARNISTSKAGIFISTSCFKLHSEMFCPHRSQNRRSHPSRHWSDADVC